MKDREIDGIFYKIFLRFSWFFTSSTLSLSTWKLDRFRIMDTRSSFSSSSSSAKKRFFTQRNYEFPCLNEAQLIPDRSPEGAKGRGKREGGREDRPPLSISRGCSFQARDTWPDTPKISGIIRESSVDPLPPLDTFLVRGS